MDIWKWVQDIDPELRRSGHQRLADLIRRLPSATVDDQHDTVDALAPEALALARAAGLPWVEVFVRHWHLQSRVLHRSQGDMALAEAVALVDFAHSEPARGCPQSVCTVQDLAACYAQVDGPGYAPERAEVSRETLARIDPTWPCFTCISSEHAGALREQGDPQAALDFLDAQQRQLAAAGLLRERASLLPERISSLIALGRFEQALAVCEDALTNGRRDEGQRTARRIDRARLLARLGRVDEAVRELPDVQQIFPTPSHYEAYTDALVQLVAVGARDNDSSLGRLLQRFVTRLEAQGSYRMPFTIAASAADLAIRRGAPAVAALHLRTMERLATRLHRPVGAPERIAAVHMSLETAEMRPLPDEPTDPEDIFLEVAAARAAAPDDPDVARHYAAALVDLGFGREAAEHLEALVAAHPDDLETVDQLALAYEQASDEDRHSALCERLLADARPEVRHAGHWHAARRLARARDFDAANRHLAAILAEVPSAIGARLLYAANAYVQNDWPLVLRLLDEVLELRPDLPAGGYDWDRMVAGTLLGAWDRVRHSAARIGMTFATDSGPIDEHWELCRIRVEHPGGRRQELYAVRTGPVTAQILQISRIDEPQRLYDTVVFDARPLGQPHIGDNGRPVYLYAEIAPLRRAGFRAFFLDGVHPGDVALANLRRAAQEHHGSLQVQSGEGYRLTAPDGSQHPGLYAYVAFPSDADLAAASAAFAALTRELPHPLVWPDLAAAAGDTALEQQHRELARAWDL